MTKFGKKMISLISGSLLALSSINGAKGMIRIESDNESDNESEINPELRRGHVFDRSELNFKNALKLDRNDYLKMRDKVRELHGKNILTEAPYNITNLVVNYPGRTAILLLLDGVVIGYCFVSPGNSKNGITSNTGKSLDDEDFGYFDY